MELHFYSSSPIDGMTLFVVHLFFFSYHSYSRESSPLLLNCLFVYWWKERSIWPLKTETLIHLSIFLDTFVVYYLVVIKSKVKFHRVNVYFFLSFFLFLSLFRGDVFFFFFFLWGGCLGWQVFDSLQTRPLSVPLFHLRP